MSLFLSCRCAAGVWGDGGYPSSGAVHKETIRAEEEEMREDEAVNEDNTLRAIMSKDEANSVRVSGRMNTWIRNIWITSGAMN